MAADEGFEERIAGEAVGAVQAGAGHFAGGMEPGHRGASAHVGGDAAAEVVRRRHDGDGLLGHVEAVLPAGGVDVREAPLQERRALVGDVEIGAGVAADLHLVVDGAGDDIARRQLGARIVALHERLARAVEQPRAFAAHGFADEERFRFGVEEAGRMELHEFHVADFEARAPGHGDAVARGDVGIAGVEVDLAGAAGGQQRVRRAHGEDFVRGPVEEIGADAGVVARHLQPAGRDQVDRQGVFEHLHGGLPADARGQDADDFRAGEIAAVQDAPDGMAAFAAQIVFRVGFARRVGFAFELHAPGLQGGDARGAAGDDFAGDGGVGQIRAGDEGVLQVRLDRVVFGDGHGDAALRMGGIAFVQRALGAQDDVAVRRQFQRGGQTRQTGTDDQEVAIQRFHGRQPSIRHPRGQDGSRRAPPFHAYQLSNGVEQIYRPVRSGGEIQE